MKTRIIELDVTDSTNRFLHDYLPETDNDLVVAVARYQTAGRGQACNSWESEPGENLLFSILVQNISVPPARQFIISMAMAVALKDCLTEIAGSGISVKWPNDIYWCNKKISGTLIETAVCRHGIRRCIIGTGINVNQGTFLSDAPNPVSLRNIMGHEVERRPVLDGIIARFRHNMGMIERGDIHTLTAMYHSALYRREGFHAYSDANGEFEAETVGVEESGRLLLRDTEGMLRKYFFKEVKFIINNK